MKIIIEKTGPENDSDDVRFDVDGVVKGYGFIGKKKKDKTIALIRCPLCRRENYMFNVSSGQCTWCPFDANKIK